MNREEKNEKNVINPETRGEKEYELSEEAKITPDQEDHIKNLGNGKAVVSSEPKFSEDEEETRSATPAPAQDFEKEPETIQEKTTKTKKPEKKIETQPEKTKETKKPAAQKPEPKPEKETNTPKITSQQQEIDLDLSGLVNMLASYGVPLDSPVRELIKEINKKGQQHHGKELDLSKLVKLLASYEVPLDSPVRELIKEINKKGQQQLEKELKKL